MTQTQPEPEKAEKAEKTADGTRYAVYDLRFERFVGPVTDKAPSAKAARDLVGHDDAEVRKV